MKYENLQLSTKEDVIAMKSWPQGENSFLLCFGNDKEIYSTILEELPQIPMIGASSTGQMSGRGHTEEGITAAFFHFDKAVVKTTRVKFDHWEDGEKVGNKIIENLQSDDLKGILVLSEGLKLNCSKMVEAIAAKKGDGVALAGGLAGDVFTYSDIFVVDNKDGIRDDSVVAVGFYGDSFHMDVFAHSGVTPMGIEREVTKAKDYALYELDGKPALDVYKQYFRTDDLAKMEKEIVKFPFSITNNYIEEGVIRTPLTFTEDGQGIQFTGAIPEGSRVRMMQSASSKFLDGVYDLSEKVKQAEKNSDSSIIAISCACRKLVLGAIVDQEAEILCDELDKKSIVGFYSFGEIGSNEHNESYLYNQTLTLISIYEE